MNERHDEADSIIRWIDKAEHDLLAAEHMMELIESGLTDIVCFHCQQCAEKYLKALLVFLGVHFPKTHDLRLLLDLVPERVSLGVRRRGSDELPGGPFSLRRRSKRPRPAPSGDHGPSVFAALPRCVYRQGTSHKNDREFST